MEKGINYLLSVVAAGLLASATSAHGAASGPTVWEPVSEPGGLILLVLGLILLGGVTILRARRNRKSRQHT